MRFTKILFVCCGSMLLAGVSAHQACATAATGTSIKPFAFGSAAASQVPSTLLNADSRRALPRPTVADGGAPLPPPTVADGGAPLPPPIVADGGAPLPPPTVADGGAPLPPPTGALADFGVAA
jgi:hypothetical protein